MNCEICKGNGYILDGNTAKPCHKCQENVILQEFYEQIPRHFKNSTLDQFQHPKKEKLVELINEFISTKPLKLYIFGSTGCGKTHLAISILRKAFKNKKTVAYYNSIDMFDLIKKSYNIPSVHDKISKFEHHIKNADIITIDDIGAENVTEWKKEELYRIINSIYENDINLIITSNCDPKTLFKKWGDRIVSRILENCTIIELKDNDKRLKKAKYFN